VKKEVGGQKGGNNKGRENWQHSSKGGGGRPRAKSPSGKHEKEVYWRGKPREGEESSSDGVPWQKGRDVSLEV